MGSTDHSSMIFWISIGVLVNVVLLTGVIWLVMRWLKQWNLRLRPSLARPQESDQSYAQQGYRARQPFPKTAQKYQ